MANEISPEVMRLQSECWSLARQIDAINAQMQPYAQQVQAIQQQIAEKMQEIEEAETLAKSAKA